MLNYVGKKSVQAKPMSRGEYNKLQGWTIPEGENPEDDGYLVMYLDGGKPNHPDFEHYISWSPKDVFERSYTVSKPYLDRLCNEIVELSDKLEKLYNFITDDDVFTAYVSEDEQLLLKKKYTNMARYQSALVLRAGAYCPSVWLSKALPVEKIP